MIGRGKSGVLLPAGLLAVGLALAAVIFLQTQESVSAQTVSAASEQPPKPVMVQQAQAKREDFSLPPLRSFEAILKRPIFSPSRRATQGSSSVVASQELGMTLTGIITSASDKFIILAPQEGGQSVRLREGEDYRGWTLTEVEQHKVVFRRGGKEEQLELVYDEPPPRAKTKKKRRADRRTTQQPSKQQTQRRTIRQNDNNNRRTNRNQNDEDDEEAEQEK